MQQPTVLRAWRNLCLGVAAVFLAGCATAPEVPGGAIGDDRAPVAAAGSGYTVVATGQHAAIRVPVTAVVSDEAAWIDAWSAITANQTDPPVRPAVSLEDHTLVVVTLGERPTGGYDVGISRVDYSPGTAVVHVKVTTPPADGMVTQVVTTPYVIAALDGAGLAVSFDGDDVDTGFEL